MCIRDSAGVDPATGEVRAGAAVEGAGSADGAAADWQPRRATITDDIAPDEMTPAKAVSYTHLRAHETVLDLVCRLLLEKKKHKHMRPID